ncbi:MAG: hypothetical protein JO235_09720 [Chroococcidiopsidaceae cyanobacterium CP_BM_RX_35]|nr:hypothetical protein [Chroococcidiopsidaceae cyanobacterium CP_BM_RX_35]
MCLSDNSTITLTHNTIVQSPTVVVMFGSTFQSRKETEQAAIDAWESHLNNIGDEITEVLATKTITQQEYKKVQAEVDVWSKRIEMVASNNFCKNTVRQALLHQMTCRDKLHQLKVLIEQSNVRLSMLESQQMMWENQRSLCPHSYLAAVGEVLPAPNYV